MKNNEIKQHSHGNLPEEKKEKTFCLKTYLIIFFLPAFYFLILVYSSIFNIYSNITFVEAFVTIVITAILAFIYSQICTLIVKFLYKKDYNSRLNKEESLRGAAHIVIIPGGVLVTGIFLSLLLFFSSNIFAGLALFAGVVVLTFFSFIYRQKRFKQTLNIDTDKKGSLLSSALLLLLVIINPVVLLSYIPVRYEFFDFQMVESRDMQNTLSPGSIVVIDKISGLTGKPDRQELVYLESPISNSNYYPFRLALKGIKNNELHYIRRVVAKPGDTINLNNGSGCVVNGELIHEDYLKEPDKNIICQLALHCDEMTLSKNSYYLLGDNRNASQDSRIWSEVNKSFLKGRVHSIIWPRSRCKLFH